ncbi:unnamed protein product, partial [Prunus brigantina]
VLSFLSFGIYWSTLARDVPFPGLMVCHYLTCTPPHLFIALFRPKKKNSVFWSLVNHRQFSFWPLNDLLVIILLLFPEQALILISSIIVLFQSYDFILHYAGYVL